MALTANSATFSYLGPVVPIPDGADLTGTNPGAAVFANLNVSGLSGVISKIVFHIDGVPSTAAGNTGVGVDHTFASDLKFTLISPNGTQVLIINEVGSSGNNFAQTILDDSAATSIQSQGSANAPFTGTFTPNSLLSAFNGGVANGLWQLEVQDFFSQDTGNIRLWGLDILTTLLMSGSVIQNSAGTPTDAEFVVMGPATTGSPSESNTISTLTFTPDSSLTIFNNLFVTHGPVTLVNNSSINLSNGTLWTSQLNVGPGGTLNGNGGIHGDLYNSGLVSPGHSPGKITVTGNYTQTPLGTLKIELAGRNASQFDQLAVGGKANLNGVLEIDRLNGFKLRRGDSFKFLSAEGGVNGEFSTIYNGFATNTILNPQVNYHEHSVTIDVPTFESYARTNNLSPNQISVARGLDSIGYDHRANKLISYLDARNVAKLPHDFDKIAPEELTSVFTLGTSLAQVQAGNIQRRTDDIRSGSNGFSAAGLAINGSTPSYSGGFGLTTGAAGPSGNDGKESKENAPVVAAESRWGAFLSGTGEWVSVGNTDNARGYDLESGGFTLGVDYKVTPNFAIGLAAGYTGTTADLTDSGRVRVNGGKIGLYATFFQNQQVTEAPMMSKDSSKEQPVVTNVAKGFYADLAAFGGYNSYDFRRSALRGDARGDTDGGELNVLVGAGYDFKCGNLTFGPTASFNYTYLGTSDFTEHGSLAPLNVHGGEGESLRTAFGLKASYDWKVGSVLIKPEIRASWQHEFGDAAYELSSSFANGAGDSFTVNGPQLGRDSVLLGAGFAVQFSERCATYFYYDGELGRKNYQSTAVTGGFRVAF